MKRITGLGKILLQVELINRLKLRYSDFKNADKQLCLGGTPKQSCLSE